MPCDYYGGRRRVHRSTRRDEKKLEKMKHWKTTLSGTVAAVSLLFTNWMVYRDLSGLPKSVGAARLMLAVAVVAAIGIAAHGWHSHDKDYKDGKDE